MSRFNPFRNPDYVSSNLTGTSSSSNVAPVTSASTSENLTTNEQHDPHPSSSSNHLPATSLSEDDPLVEDLPPAYTPTPDVYEGETTLELGPRRPFQQAPTYLPPPGRPSLYPEAQRAASTRVRPSATGSHLAPPRHPYLARSASSSRIDQRSTIPDSPSTRVSDFARDFYTAGADTSLLNGASTQNENGGGSRPAPAPPHHHHTQSSSNLPNPSLPPDDGRPTERPTPGHPLLRNGKVLVYPTGYECRKCHNTGFKNYDPSHPCSHCWEKYARQYSSALAHSQWTSSSAASTTYQRPLPRFTPPQRAGPSPRPASYDAPSRSSDYPGAFARDRIIPIPGGGVPMSPYLDPIQQQRTGVLRAPVVTTGRPPPGSVVLKPGDPRLGGHLCWRCGGRGLTTFLLFDEITCDVCGGIGRTYN